jgi:hypothetical protein
MTGMLLDNGLVHFVFLNGLFAAVGKELFLLLDGNVLVLCVEELAELPHPISESLSDSFQPFYRGTKQKL